MKDLLSNVTNVAGVTSLYWCDKHVLNVSQYYQINWGEIKIATSDDISTAVLASKMK